MRKLRSICLPALAGMAVLTLLHHAAAQQPGPDLSWAFAVAGKDAPPEPDAKEVVKLPPSARTYTREQIDDLSNPPDWYPNEHPPAPAAVIGAPGRKAVACGSCHLMTGSGHPGSAGLDVYPAEYIERQMAYFRDDTRKGIRMNAIAKTVTPQEDRDAAAYFAALKPQAFTKVIETDMVPETYVNRVRERFVKEGGRMEPIGNRIITVPQDKEREDARDPHFGYIAYVPKGSIGKGEALVKTGGNGKSIQCEICHGAELKGLGEVPRLAGLHPIYVARQLYDIKRGESNGKAMQLMKRVVVNLSDDDILNISAYVASLKP